MLDSMAMERQGDLCSELQPVLTVDDVRIVRVGRRGVLPEGLTHDPRDHSWHGALIAPLMGERIWLLEPTRKRESPANGFLEERPGTRNLWPMGLDQD